MDKTSPFDDVGTAGSVASGRGLIVELVHTFYADVRSDRILGPTFDVVIGDRWGPHLARMVEFWCTVMLETRSFKGNVLAKHMAVSGVTPEHFARWLAYWFSRTSEFFTPAAAVVLQRAALGIAKMLYRGYFGAAADFEGIVSEAREMARVRKLAALPASTSFP
ncbi:MAG: group III truncated hemoglobin [Rhodoferax sp.]